MRLQAGTDSELAFSATVGTVAWPSGNPWCFVSGGRTTIRGLISLFCWKLKDADTSSVK